MINDTKMNKYFVPIGIFLFMGLISMLLGCSPSKSGTTTATSGVASTGGGSNVVSKSLKGGREAAIDPSLGVETSGQYIADSGFRSSEHGFSFENYGNEEIENLTANEIQRIFQSRRVCSDKNKKKCDLTPSARRWMRNINEAMNGGHCEGMAVLSLLLYQNIIQSKVLGSQSIKELQLKGNRNLQHEIAYWFSFQAIKPTSNEEFSGPPSFIVRSLIESLSAKNPSQFYVLGIYMPDGSGGHAITPWAVEDKGDQVYWILVYDNNFPGMNRAVVVDAKNETWSYYASTNPNEPSSLYSGDANTLNLTLSRLGTRFMPQVCGFCEQGEQEPKPNEAPLSLPAEAKVETMPVPTEKVESTPEPQYNEVWIETSDPKSVDFFAVDEEDHRIGYVNGVLVNNFPGAKGSRIRSDDLWSYSELPPLKIPLGKETELQIIGKNLEKPALTNLSLIGPGFAVAVDDIQLDKDQQDSIVISEDGDVISYQTSYPEAPDISLGYEGTDADYIFYVESIDLDKDGGLINLSIQKEKDEGALFIDTTGNENRMVFNILMIRIDENGEQVFYHEGIVMLPNDTVLLVYGKWTGEDGTVTLLYDHNGDSEFEESLDLEDVAYDAELLESLGLSGEDEFYDETGEGEEEGVEEEE